MSGSERRRELKRRRHRKKKLAVLRRKLDKANNADREGLMQKIRALTPGADQIIANIGANQS